MRLTGSAKSTQKRGVMAPRRTHYPQILFLEKKDPWGTVSGLENPLPFLGYLSHSVLYRISKCAHCKLCNNGMFAPFDEGCSLVLQQILRFYTLFWLTNLKIRFCFFCIHQACLLSLFFISWATVIFAGVKFHFSLPRFAAYHCVFSTCGLHRFVHTNPLPNHAKGFLFESRFCF